MMLGGVQNKNFTRTKGAGGDPEERILAPTEQQVEGWKEYTVHGRSC
uniref:Uncharacterized protein n=1 Tax=Anguilla anguilla TaxID=7936 RepID=A0A0E9TQK1_ANGAN